VRQNCAAAPAAFPELARLQATRQDEQRTLLRTHIERVEEASRRAGE
jgi:hypothetical protein